jgi:hypothetical protein
MAAAPRINESDDCRPPIPCHPYSGWLAHQPRASLFTTAVTRGEILYGIRLLSDGKRRKGLWDAANKIFDEDFAGQVFGFDSDASDMYAELAASRRIAGKPIVALHVNLDKMPEPRRETFTA